MPDVELPEPRRAGSTSLEAALDARRSTRSYAARPLTLAEIAQLLWAAQGASAHGRLTIPSAGALYPLEVYLVAGAVEGLDAGVYRYLPREHALARQRPGDRRGPLAQAALEQESVAAGAAVLVIAATYRRTTGKYGPRGVRYAHIEAGHAAQNIYLQAEALQLGTVLIGAFDDDKVSRLLGLAKETAPLALMPVGGCR